MSLAPLAHVLFTRVMKYDASRPDWADRDRFVLSVGHASILQYAMLHLAGFGLTLDDLKDFRQWGRRHRPPEVGHTAGVEVTTGPLGQGVANAVGMAIAESQLRTRYGGTCSITMSSPSPEMDASRGHQSRGGVARWAPRPRQARMIYDDNHITIDGEPIWP